MLKEFKEFAFKGNVLDMAVGVIIGGAFGAIITSLVEDLLMPLISLIIGTPNFSSLAFMVGNTVIPYGNLIQNIVNFLIIAFSIFLFVKLINKTNRKKEEAPAPDPEPGAEERLLTEIRDLLKDR